MNINEGFIEYKPNPNESIVNRVEPIIININESYDKIKAEN